MGINSSLTTIFASLLEGGEMRLACLREDALYTEGRDAGFFLENRGRWVRAVGTA